VAAYAPWRSAVGSVNDPARVPTHSEMWDSQREEDPCLARAATQAEGEARATKAKISRSCHSGARARLHNWTWPRGKGHAIDEGRYLREESAMPDRELKNRFAGNRAAAGWSNSRQLRGGRFTPWTRRHSRNSWLVCALSRRHQRRWEAGEGRPKISCQRMTSARLWSAGARSMSAQALALQCWSARSSDHQAHGCALQCQPCHGGNPAAVPAAPKGASAGAAQLEI
jgi:hypothetical protein